MPTAQQIRQGYQVPRKAPIRTVVASPADLAAREPRIAVMHTALEAGRYIQHNQGEALARLLIDFINENSIETVPIPRIPCA